MVLYQELTARLCLILPELWLCPGAPLCQSSAVEVRTRPGGWKSGTAYLWDVRWDGRAAEDGQGAHPLCPTGMVTWQQDMPQGQSSA